MVVYRLWDITMNICVMKLKEIPKNSRSSRYFLNCIGLYLWWRVNCQAWPKSCFLFIHYSVYRGREVLLIDCSLLLSFLMGPLAVLLSSETLLTAGGAKPPAAVFSAILFCRSIAISSIFFRISSSCLRAYFIRFKN